MGNEKAARRKETVDLLQTLGLYHSGDKEVIAAFYVWKRYTERTGGDVTIENARIYMEEYRTGIRYRDRQATQRASDPQAAS